MRFIPFILACIIVIGVIIGALWIGGSILYLFGMMLAGALA